MIDTEGLGWRKPERCETAACVEVAPLIDGGAAVRDSKTPGGPILTFTHKEWATFIEAVKQGEYDLP